MMTFSVQSGSNGNCIYVEAGGTGLLFDAGISGRRATERMLEHDRRPHDAQALFVSHEHGDHIRGAGVFHRLFKLPLYITRPTLEANTWHLGRLHDVRHFDAGQTLKLGDVTVHTLPTPHDAVDAVSFVVESDGCRLGIFTDLGHPFTMLSEALGTVDAAYLESNYDVDMLAKGPYPENLKRRIAGRGGHLSNLEAAELVRGVPGGRLQWLALSHLSEHNNTARAALATHRAVLGSGLPIHVAPRHKVSAALRVSRVSQPDRPPPSGWLWAEDPGLTEGSHARVRRCEESC